MRYYSSTAVAMALTGAVSEIATTFVVDTALGLPAQTPFTLVVDVGLSTEEIVTVTGVAGTSLTVTRGEDGTSAVAHTIGAVARHMMTARDLREPAVHVDGTTYVHGIGATASVVGTDTTQTLTNKTLNFANNTVTGVPQASVTGLVDDLVDLVTADAALANADAIHAAVTVTHGATGAVVGTTNTQTLTHKTINFADNTAIGIPQASVTDLVDDMTALVQADADTGVAIAALPPFAEYLMVAVCAANGSFSGTFPADLFTVAPLIEATVQTNTQYAFANALATSATAFSGYCAFFSAGAFATTAGFTIAIHAIQTTATTARS